MQTEVNLLLEIHIDSSKQIMCLMQISDILYEVMLFFGQNMSHCVMSQTVLNGITVTNPDRPLRHTKRNEVFLRLFCNHWIHSIQFKYYTSNG